MKKTLQPAHETQEVTKQNSAVTSNHRTGRIGYTSFRSQGSSKFSATSLRNKRETVDKTAVKSNGLKNGGSFHCDRSDSLKPGICGGDISVSEQTEVSDVAVTNVSLCSGLSGDSSDENIETGGRRPKSCPVLQRSAPADKEKAKDRLVKSHSHIEQLQQNLATKLSTATVATFIHEYSPALYRRSHSNVGRSPLIDRKLNGRGSCGSSNVTGPFPTSRNQDNIRNNRKIRYPKSSLRKGDSLGSILIKKKFVFFNGFFGRSVIKCNRKQIDSHKKDVRSPDETEGSRNLDINSPVQSVENGLTRLEGKKGNQHHYSDGPSADYISPNCGKTDVNSNKAVPSDTFEKDTEATDKGRNPPPSNSPGPYGDNRSGASQQTSKTLEPPSKPARVSWTTALIQKLTEEEARKKTKSQTKAQKPKRTVRFPQKKPPKVVNEEKAKFSEGFQKRRESAPLSRPTTEILTKQSDSEGNSVKKDIKENPSGVILDDKSKDAYANLVSQLLVSKNEGDSQQVSELKGEDFFLKQSELEEIRAAIAREECASVISDDDSVILAPITASKESIEAGRRKEPKPSGIRRLLPQGLFAQKHRQVDRADEGCAQEPLLNRADTSRVYPATTTARPVLETAFLSDPNSKLPVRSGVRQQQRSQSSSPSPRHKQPSPRTRRRQDRDQTSIQENEQNSSRISHQTRSKSLSPARDRSSSAASRTSKRTIPDTSLVLEERLQHIRRELSSPPGRDVTRPSSATPPNYPNRVPQRHNSLPLSSNKTIQQEKIYHITGRVYSSAPSNAYYHSPPSRRRQQNKEPKNDLKADDYRRKVSGGSSASSSSSTIVAESPPVSALSWNPLLLNLENNAISGSPDIRKFQQHRQPQHASADSGLYGEIRNSVDRDSSALASHRIDTPNNYSPSNSGLSRKPQGLLQVHHDTTVLQQRSPTSVPSGRLSAPTVASYNIEDYPKRRVRSPEPHRSRQEYEYDQSSRRSLSQPPRLGQSDQKSSQRPSFRPVNPTDKGLARPVAAQLQIKSPQSRPMPDDNVNSRETQTARSYIHPQHQQLEKNHRNRPHDQQRKLSRQEVEALYWETQKLREGLSSLSQNMSLHPPKLGVRYSSTASLPQQAFSAYRSSIRSEQSSPMLYQPEAVPRQPFRTQSVQNVGGGYGSPILRPQPVYNIVQQHQPVRQARTSHDTNPRAPRARSASPGPNSNRHLSSRSLSLPRSIPSPVMLENQHYKSSDSVMSNFARGVPHRNTIGPIRTSSHFPHSPQIRQQSTPTIYEETQQQVGDEVRLRHAERYEHATEVDAGSGKTQIYVNTVMNRNPSAGDGNGDNKSGSGKRSKKSSSQQMVSPQPYYPPIFKRGSLISTSPCSVDVDSPMSPKRVSFSSYDEPLYWPTRNGPAPEPPTRQRKAQSTNPDPLLRYEEYSTYANVPQAPNRPLPPVPHDANGSTYGSISRKSRDSKSPTSGFPVSAQRWQQLSESESGSEAGEVQRILQQGSHGRGTYVRFPDTEEEWGADGKSRGPPGTDQSVSNVGRDEEVRRGGGGGGRSGRRDEPRRHTLSGDHHHHQQGSALARSMDLEMSSKSQRRKSPLPRGYPPPSSAMLFDDDPGIMSEVETSSTGFRRGGKQRSSLPVVRTPSKTLERPLGKTSGAGVPIGVGPMLRISPHPSAMATHHHQMVQLLNHHHGLSNKHSSATATSGGLVFLQYRNETKRALLPNEITSIDTVKALFVRSFPKQLTMEYLDSPHVKIYIHDSSKDMFYELEDLRSHLRDIRDRSVLRLFESTDMNGGVLPGAGVGVMAPPMWDQDQTYWSEPEFDSEYQHQHIHKTKASSKSGSSGGGPPQAPYYMTHSYPPGGTQGAPGASATLPRGGPLLRAYSPAVAPVPADRIKSLPQTDRLHSESGYMSSPERGGPRAYPAAAYPPGGPGYEDPYYSQYASRSGSITPVIDEEASDTELIDESYSLYGVKLPTAGRSVVAPQPRSQFPAPAVVPYDTTRIRVEHMERQLANLTGLVQKALTQTPTPREYLQVPPPASARDANYRNGV